MNSVNPLMYLTENFEKYEHPMITVAIVIAVTRGSKLKTKPMYENLQIGAAPERYV